MSNPRATPLYECLIMEPLILSSPLVLLQLISMVMVVACLIMEISLYSRVSQGHLMVKTRSILIPVTGTLTVIRSR